MRKHLRRRAVVGALALAGLLGAAVVPASAADAGKSGASPTARTTAYSEREARQQPLKQAASLIRGQVERGDDHGYAGIELADAEVVLWWKGTPSASIQQVIAQATAHAPVRVAAAPHSRAELKAAAAHLRATLDVRPDRPVHSIKLAVNGHGLRVLAEPSTVVAQSALVAVGVPVDVVHRSAPVRTSRADDWAPWSGGADLLNSNGTRCTSGFGVRNGDNARYVLTAAHCASPGQAVFDGTWEFVGNMGPRHDYHDIALIPTSNVDDQIYIGGLHDNTTAVVEGWDWVYAGEWLCQAGGSSAREGHHQICGLRVTDFVDEQDAVEAEQVDNQVAVRGGDSGGPVYSWNSGTVVAKGTTMYRYEQYPNIIGFQDFGTATRDFGIWIAK
nr:hypothetical protein [Kibdelosporangium sp. MJ126-NF4]